MNTIQPTSPCDSSVTSYAPSAHGADAAPAAAHEPKLHSTPATPGDAACARAAVSTVVPRRAATPITAMFFPIEPGTKQVYSTTISPTSDPDATVSGSYTLLVEGVKRKEGEIEVELRTSDSYTDRARLSRLRLFDDRVLLEGVTFLGVGEQPAPDLSTEFLRLPLAVGARWDDGQWIGEVREQVRVNTPLGERDAWRVLVIGTYDHTYTAVGSYWVTPGMGVVRAELSIEGWNVVTELSAIAAPAA